MKKLLYLLFLLVATSAVAQDVIIFKWLVKESEEAPPDSGIGQKHFYICATAGKNFTIDWGDGNIQTYTGQNNGWTEPCFHDYLNMTEDFVTFIVTITALTEDCRFTYFNCSYCQITNLDISNCTALTYLDCFKNQLTNLNLSNNTALTKLFCDFNDYLGNLDLSNNTALTSLGCSKNNLENLDLSNHAVLTDLSCGINHLTNLDLSNNTALTYLNCSSNHLTNLDLSNNTALTKLDCYNNHLTNLDLSNNTTLTDLDCDKNHIPLSCLYLIPEIFQYNKYLGTQTLISQTVNIGDTLFSEQALFDGIFTNYAVTQNNIPVSESEYEIIEGKLIFNTAGNYIVTMTNAAIISAPNFPAKAIVEVTVLNEFFIKENNKSNIQIYPNPTNGQLTIRNEELGITNYNIEIFDITNRKIFTKTITDIEQIIDISHLQSGIYFLKIDKEIVKFIKN